MNHRLNLLFGSVAVLLAAVGAWVVPSKREAPPIAVEAPLEAPVPLEEWTADAGMVRRQIQQAMLGKLPSPLPGQKTKDCDPELGEEFRNGGCWTKITTVHPPCPKDKLYEDNGMCFRPIPRTAKTPTSGGGQVPALADP